MKTLLATFSALALFALAACDGGGDAPPQSGSTDMNQTEPMTTTPTDPAPAQ